MHIDQLVRMANDIGNFFAVEPDRDSAIESIRFHLRRFWEPRMRKQIIEHLQAGGDGLNDDVRAAVQLLAQE